MNEIANSDEAEKHCYSFECLQQLHADFDRPARNSPAEKDRQALPLQRKKVHDVPEQDEDTMYPETFH